MVTVCTKTVLSQHGPKQLTAQFLEHRNIPRNHCYSSVDSLFNGAVPVSENMVISAVA